MKRMIPKKLNAYYWFTEIFTGAVCVAAIVAYQILNKIIKPRVKKT